ncbi:BTB/POZ domain-containing protein 19 isoform X4 [Monodelphis domestica]|uniref:BTB/POZ domain-containing protein 19 isoform X4 n=1 Tax=Monodelphis domestica TaxID=13616 RepID=UPI0024E204BE|nr:BTB/POZ domain-containing protein 19 isoform X4 [Monodelphis domestica]
MGQAAPSAPEKLSSGAGEPPGGGASRRAGPSDQERPSSPGVTGSDAGQAIQCFRAGSSGGGRLGLAGAWAPHAGGNSSTYLNSGRPRARSRSRQEGLRSRTRGRLRASSSGSASASGTGSGLALASKTAWAMAPPGGGALAPGHTHLMQGDPATFRSALRGLLNCTRFSDVRFVVGQDRREVLAHRCVLTSRCDYFRQLLGTELPDKGCQEEPVVLADVPAEAFLTVLEFLYTNSITLDRRTVLEVMISSLEYGLSELRELCVEFVVQNLDVELVCEALQVAVTFGLRLLRDRCLNFIDCHAQDVLRTPAFHELSAAALVPVLRSDRLAVDEVELIAATRHWARVSSAVLEQPMVEVAQSVVGELRLPLLNASELSTLEEQNRVEPFIPVEQIAEAWKCHALRGGESIRTSSSLGRRRKGTTPREHHYYLESS